MLHLELPLFHHPSSKWEQSPPKPGNAQHDFAENEKKKNYNMKVQAWKVIPYLYVQVWYRRKRIFFILSKLSLYLRIL